MKLNQNSLIFLVNKDNFGDFSEKETKEIYGTEKLVLPDSERELMNDNKGYRMLVLSQKVRYLVNSFIVSNELKFDVLRSLPNRTDLIMIDENFVVKYKKTNEFVDLLFFNIDEKKEYIKYKYIQFDLINEKTFPEIDEKQLLFYDDNDIREGGDFSEDVILMWKKFLSVITFLELTPTILLIVNGGEKKGDIMRDNFIKNESKSTVIQVNSNWNIKTVRIGGFDVRGHYRLMLVGKGRTRYEYVFIKPYKKGIIRRLPQKVTVEQLN